MCEKKKKKQNFCEKNKDTKSKTHTQNFLLGNSIYVLDGNVNYFEQSFISRMVGCDQVFCNVNVNVYALYIIYDKGK